MTKFFALFLAFYVLLLSFSPTMKEARLPAGKKLCQCCSKKAARKQEKSSKENSTLGNPFYGCNQCAATLQTPIFAFDKTSCELALPQYYAEPAQIYLSPSFDFWQPPKIAIG